MPYDLTLRDGSYHELHGPWRVDAAAELIRAQAAAEPAAAVRSWRSRSELRSDEDRLRRAGRRVTGLQHVVVDAVELAGSPAPAAAAVEGWAPTIASPTTRTLLSRCRA